MGVDRFSHIVERARAAERTAEDAWGKTRDQLRDDIDRAAARAEQLETQADSKASSSWSELGGTWRAQMAKVKIALGQKERKIDARLAAREADIAESDAAYAVDIAISAVEEAEDTVLYAIYARKYAEEIA